jgi:hypothetical protein
MKKYLVIIALLSLFVIGCSEQASINSPAASNSAEPNWIALPKADGMQVNTDYTVSKTIDGSKGGSLSNSVSYSGFWGKVTITGSITFPKGAFGGKKEITMTNDNLTTVTKFGPSMDFIKDALYNLKFTGLDLSWLDVSTLKFAYLAADGSVQYAVNDGIFVDTKTGTLEVRNARIPHFSRYGFVN